MIGLGLLDGVDRVATEAETREVHLVRRMLGEQVDLGDHDLVDAAHEPCTGEREHVADEARVDTGAVQRRAALVGTRLRGARSRPDRATAGTRTRRRDEVLARAEDRAHVVDVEVERRVVHAVGVESEDLRPCRSCTRTPSGSMPAISPASTPCLASDVTYTPTSSKFGLLAKWRIEIWPIEPGRPLDDPVRLAVRAHVLMPGLLLAGVAGQP